MMSNRKVQESCSLADAIPILPKTITPFSPKQFCATVFIDNYKLQCLEHRVRAQQPFVKTAIRDPMIESDSEDDNLLNSPRCCDSN